ncbi:uncharacterized protein PpBr36_10389 [Pyricularia pennisetigena]|uniref:uncharacterized protein n=1 Tax=Pyricularia pennisetigena TaxID=1578925 RepID=UPI00114D521C|nr:uncharacterized protein PpBr36_10389 [Pyricularia pennisetigena]TLS21587.1 hypothetical protein PpBr36_10389 [Pyricularia pennisetigena]
MMDSASLSLAIQLMLEDLDALKSGIKGKGRENDGPPDIAIATEFFRKELATQAVLASDRTMCESIAEAVTKDADTIRCLDPEQAQRDTQLDDELVDKLKLLYVTDREEPVEDNQDQDHELRRSLPCGALAALLSGAQVGIAPVAATSLTLSMWRAVPVPTNTAEGV